MKQEKRTWFKIVVLIIVFAVGLSAFSSCGILNSGRGRDGGGGGGGGTTQIRVSFEAHGGEGTAHNLIVTRGSEYGVLPFLTKEGYTFAGWRTEQSGEGTEIREYTVVEKSSSHTLHAHWIENTPLSFFRFAPIYSGTAYSIGITFGTRLHGQIALPATFNGLPVRAIVQSGFRHGWSGNGFAHTFEITFVFIPQSITIIGDFAFQGCAGLENISLPSSLTTIGQGAFRNSGSLKSISIPADVTSIQSYTFFDCVALERLTFAEGNNLSAISESAFFGCVSLKELTIPAKVEVVDRSAFSDCTALERVNFEEGSRLVAIGTDAFRNCSSLKYITLPDTVTTIGTGAFRNCTALEQITLPETLTTIGSGAFENCSSLRTLRMPYGLTSIGAQTFRNCESLESIEIPHTLTSIGGSAFQGCIALSNIYFSGSAPQWNAIAGRIQAQIPFDTRVHFATPTVVVTVGFELHGGAGTAESRSVAVGIPYGILPVLSKSGYTFAGWRTEQNGEGTLVTTETVVTLDSNHTLHAHWVEFLSHTPHSYFRFYPVNQGTAYSIAVAYGITLSGSVVLPPSLNGLPVVEIIDDGFSDLWFGNQNARTNGITSLTLPPSITRIGGYAFWNCTGLTSIVIPSSVTSIGGFAFEGCTSLTDIFFTGTQTQWSAISGIGSASIPFGVTRHFNFPA
jgi:uncharacterized repeat protein (TIGR02543 family)